MSGWYVARLLLDSERIRSELIRESLSFEITEGFNVTGYIDINGIFSYVNPDQYDDLLSVEMEISKLHKKGAISDEDLEILSYVITNKSFLNLSRKYGVSRWKISKRFKQLCAYIAFTMGEHFTDDGYLEYLRTKYYLTKEDIAIAKMYMNNGFKYRSNRNKKNAKKPLHN